MSTFELVNNDASAMMLIFWAAFVVWLIASTPERPQFRSIVRWLAFAGLLFFIGWQDFGLPLIILGRP